MEIRKGYIGPLEADAASRVPQRAANSLGLHIQVRASPLGDSREPSQCGIVSTQASISGSSAG